MKKKNNHGFTLIELMVSVTVLAIIVIPLLNSFVTVAKTNAKAKRVLNATTAGQNLVEKIKTERSDELITNALAATASIVELKADGTVATDDDGNSITVSAGGSFQSDTMYRMDYPVVNVNGQKYRARVLLDPTKYMEPADPAGGSGGAAANYFNSTEMTQIANMNPKASAFLVMNPTDDLKAAKKLDDVQYTKVLEQYLNRTIQIDIAYDGASATVTGKITYTNTDPGRESTMPYETISDLGTIYSSAGTDAEGNAVIHTLENLFVCFTPMYRDTSGHETIIINNPSGCPVKIYLVKQASSETNVVKLERYGVDVSLNEGIGDCAAQVFTNLLPSPNMTDPVERVQGKINFNYRQGGNPVPAASTPAIGELANKEAVTRIYDITVKVYQYDENFDDIDSGAVEPLATITGTKTE